CFLGFLCLVEPDRRFARVVSGLCLGLAVFAYPPLLLAVVFCLALRLALATGTGRRATALYDLPAAAVPLVAMAGLVTSEGVGRVTADNRARTAGQGQGDPHTLHTLVSYELHGSFRHPYVVIAATVGLLVMWTRSRRVSLALLILLPLLLAPRPLDAG